MYCPKCMIEIQGNGEMACPNCTTALADSSLLSDNDQVDNKNRHVHATFDADDIIQSAERHTNSASTLKASQEQVFFLEDEIDDTVDEQTGLERDNTTFDSIISNTSGDIHQNNTQKLLDQAFEEIDTADEQATTPSGKSLAISVVLGALLLVCVIGTGIYYLNHIPDHEAITLKPERILSLPSSNAPAPTLKSSRAAEQQSQAVQAHTGQDFSHSLQENLPDQTPVAVVQQKNTSPSGEFAALQKTVPAQPQQKNEALPGGNDTQQSSTAASTINSMSDSATGSHILLCGSFQDKNKALNLAKKIKAKGYPAFVEKADIALKGIWYRIKIAGFSSKNAAEKARDELKGKLKLEAVVAKRK